MRLCVVGNSHVAALRGAHGPGPTLGGHVIDFYAVPGGQQPTVEIVDGRLIPLAPRQGVLTTVEGAESKGLVLSGYDVLVISACGLMAARNENVLPDPISHPCGSLVCAGWKGLSRVERTPELQAVSSAVFEACVEDYVRDHASVRLLARLGACFSGLVLVQPWPAPNRSLRFDADWFVNAWYGALGPSVWDAFFAAQRRALAAIASELGPRVTFMDYPSHGAPSADGFMDGAWCAVDPWHGNERYGALVLDQIVDRLKQPMAAGPRSEVDDGPASPTQAGQSSRASAAQGPREGWKPTMYANGFRRVYCYHLKKCGGTSLDHWLAKQVSDGRANDPRWLKPLVDAFLDDAEPSAEARRLERTIGCSVFHWTDAVLSHMPLRHLAPQDTLCVTMLRAPVDRLVSQIADWRRLSLADHAGVPDRVATMIQDASALSLRSFLEAHGRGALLLDNYLVRALAAVRLGFSVKAVAKAADLLPVAMEAMSNDFHIIGLTDQFRVSLNAVAERLGRVPEDQPPALNETSSKLRLSDEVEQAEEILAELTAADRFLYGEAERLFAERHAVSGTAYDRDAFERLYAADAVDRLSGSRRGDATAYSVRGPLVGSGFHGRDAAGSERCRVWSGPSAHSVLYMPVPAGAPLALRLWVHGYADERQRDNLVVTLDGVRADHRFIAEPGYREVIEIVGTPSRTFAALGLDVGVTVPAGHAGSPGHDARLRGLSFDRYGWTILP